MLEKKKISYKEFEALGMFLQNDNGYTYLFFDTNQKQQEVVVSFLKL